MLGTKNNPDLTSVSTTMVSGIDAIEVTGSGYRARIALVGATLLDWRTVSSNGQEGESLIDGYRDIEELQSQNGVRNGILAPFCNRIEGGKFYLAGSAYQISPVAAKETAVYHGFARVRPFKLHKVDSDGENVRAVFCLETSEGDVAGYPFSLRITVVYIFTATGVELQIAGTNLSQQSAPFAAGWHPYFQISGTTPIDDLFLQLPSKATVATTDLLPRIGSDAKILIERNDAFVAPAQVGSRVMDCCFTDLVVDQAGIAQTILADLRSGTRLSVWQEGGHMHVFTGDTLARDGRMSIALEPVEELTNAFNLPGRIDNLLLKPGQTRLFRCGFTLESPDLS
ncbi:aldose 1-epimerase [Agrobacterium tumefaciens]|uniref:aldose 1-epimerase n=1 Tax=Agrobacterium tumefaciens TaxID=358 RepID=UPI001F1B6E99